MTRRGPNLAVYVWYMFWMLCSLNSNLNTARVQKMACHAYHIIVVVTSAQFQCLQAQQTRSTLAEQKWFAFESYKYCIPFIKCRDG